MLYNSLWFLMNLDRPLTESYVPSQVEHKCFAAKWFCIGPHIAIWAFSDEQRYHSPGPK